MRILKSKRQITVELATDEDFSYLTWERLIALRLQKVIPLILMALCLSSHKLAAIRQRLLQRHFKTIAAHPFNERRRRL